MLGGCRTEVALHETSRQGHCPSVQIEDDDNNNDCDDGVIVYSV